ncbi:MAG: hypothetical protein MUE81_08030 [Thermoflexibacter sp.]|jgi:hypothetical protein|nr:hypothetical protein [Thermoflexibacter sp.]
MRFLFLLVITYGNLFASTNDTLYNKEPFLIYFNANDTSMHFKDRNNDFHFYEKNTFLSGIVSFRGLKPYPLLPDLIDSYDDVFYFTFWDMISLHGVDYHIKYIFKYDRQNKQFGYIPFSDHDSDSNCGIYDYSMSITGAKYEEGIKIIRRRNKTYLRIVLLIYSLEKNKPQKIKKIYVEDKLGEQSYYKGYYFKLIFIKHRSHFQVNPYVR